MTSPAPWRRALPGPTPSPGQTARRAARRTRLAPALCVALLALLALSGCGGDETETPVAESGQCDYVAGGEAARPVDAPDADPPAEEPTELTLQTDRGDVLLSLDAEQAPCAVNSLVSLAEQGYFDDTTCHRLTTGGPGGLNVLQCGDPTGTGTGTPGYSFADELVDQDPRLQPCLGQVDPASGAEVCTYPAGTLAMANAGPDTNGSQFFLVYEDSPLPASYTVMGRMSAAGLKVVRDVAAAGVQGGGPDGPPAEPVTITGVTD